MNKIFLILVFSFLLLSCEKETVEPKPELTPEQREELVELIKLNPGVPINVLIGLLEFTDIADQTGILDANDTRTTSLDN